MLRRRLLVGMAATAGVPSLALAAKSARGPAPIPPGYAVMGRRHGVPPQILYGVALQESMLLFGTSALPHPWTLGVRGVPMRFTTYGAAVQHLASCVRQGTLNVDCGSMQVNWFYFSDRLRSFSNALDPYPNIAVGAQILREHYERTRDWFQAVGRYHHQRDAQRATRYATSVFTRLLKIPSAAVGRPHG